MALICIFLITNDMVSPFSCAYWQYILHCESSLHTVSLFLNWVVCLYYWVVGVLKIYILDTKSLSDIQVVIFHPFLACLFIFQMVSERVKVLNLGEVWFISIFKISAFCALSEKSLSAPLSWKYTLLFSSRIFVVLTFTFRSVIHLELIFWN